jgi:nucleosome binding factor SPN SPT16 subunit
LFPDMTDPNAVFVKELTLKNKDKKGESNHLRVAEKLIKDLIKKSKIMDQEEEEKKGQEAALQTLKHMQGRKETLENVVVKPNLEGRKTIGNLEIHHNGISYVSTKGYRVDVPFSNIKHAFF